MWKIIKKLHIFCVQNLIIVGVEGLSILNSVVLDLAKYSKFSFYRCQKWTLVGFLPMALISGTTSL